MVLETLAALDRPQVPDDAEMSVAHPSQMAILEVPHVVSMHWLAMPSILDRLESNRWRQIRPDWCITPVLSPARSSRHETPRSRTTITTSPLRTVVHMGGTRHFPAVAKAYIYRGFRMTRVAGRESHSLRHPFLKRDGALGLSRGWKARWPGFAVESFPLFFASFENGTCPECHSFGLQCDPLRRVVMDLGDGCHSLTFRHLVARQPVAQDSRGGAA
jgi:hypothetical protein